MQSDRKKMEELAVVQKVAVRLGGTARLSESDPPDAWIDVPTAPDPIPVEVVRGHQWPEGEHPDPTRGAPAARAWTEAERQAEALRQAGVPGTISFIHNAQEAVTVAAHPGAATRVGVFTRRLDDALSWAIEAVRPKCMKAYPPGTILVLDFQDNWPLDPAELAALGAFVADQTRSFRAVWVCPELAQGDDEAQLVPFPSR